MAVCIKLYTKALRQRSAGKPHAALDVSGAGIVPMGNAPVLDPTREYLARKFRRVTRPPVERFFSSPKRECTGDRLYRTRREAIADVQEYVTVYYKSKHLHPTIGYITPLEYEKKLSKVSGNG